MHFDKTITQNGDAEPLGDHLATHSSVQPTELPAQSALPYSAAKSCYLHLRHVRRLVRSLRGLYAVRYWRSHLKLARVLSQPGLVELLRRRPRLLFKYLHSRYLVVGLDTACRLATLTHHYTLLSRSLDASFLRTMLSDGVELWRYGCGPEVVCIVLSFPHHDFEGELLLSIYAEDMPIYTLTVTFASNEVVNSEYGSALLITCLQGGAGQLHRIRKATRACANTPPPYLLIAAVEGLGAAFAVRRIAAVGNARQLGWSGGTSNDVSFDYDLFWRSLDGARTSDGFFLFPARFPEKPLQAFPSRHRSRERRKRELRRGIREAVMRCVNTARATTVWPSPPQ